MPEQVTPSTQNTKQNEYSPAPQSQLTQTPPANEVRMRVIYARLCYVAAALLMSLSTYLFVARHGLEGLISPIFFVVPLSALFACLVTVAHYLVQTRHTIANRSDLFYHLRKLLPLVILISFLICVSIMGLFWTWVMSSADYGNPLEGMLTSLVITIASLIALFLSLKKARSLSKQIPATPSKKLGGIILLLLILPVCATAITYNLVNNQIIENQNRNYVDSELWTFVPTSATHSLSLMDRIVFPADGIWYFDGNNHVAYYDFNQKNNTFISKDSYNYKTDQWILEEIYGDYFIFRPTSLSETADKEAEYIMFNNKKANAVKAVIPQPSQVYDNSGNRYTILPSDLYALRSRDSFKKGKSKDTILAEIPVSINQGGDYDQYIEIDLVGGKVTESDKQSYNNAKYNHSTTFDLPIGTPRRYKIDYIDNNYEHYVIDNETGAKVKLPSRPGYCEISGGEKYLICDTEHLQWWTDKSKKGFVYWSLADLMK